MYPRHTKLLKYKVTVVVAHVQSCTCCCLSVHRRLDALHWQSWAMAAIPELWGPQPSTIQVHRWVGHIHWLFRICNTNKYTDLYKNVNTLETKPWMILFSSATQPWFIELNDLSANENSLVFTVNRPYYSDKTALLSMNSSSTPLILRLLSSGKGTWGRRVDRL